jgi:starch synthase (maltosyl-transferring)
MMAGTDRAPSRPPSSMPDDGRVRVVIEDPSPRVDCGRFAAKRTLGDSVQVETDLFTDGHDAVAGLLLYRHEADSHWRTAWFEPLGNDRWRARFVADALGRWLYTVQAWVDHFETWRRDLEKRHAADQDLRIEFTRGARMVQAAAARAKAHGQALAEWARRLGDEAADAQARYGVALDTDLASSMREHPQPELIARYPDELMVWVDPVRARFSTWYELFPRSASADPQRHGTFRDCIARLPYIADLGFDVLYLPPIHPIGTTSRKGANNRLGAQPDDPGSPWAIGGPQGGHKSVHPQLGTLDDFRALVSAARSHGIDIALDIAYQCSPDHPYAAAHREWFLERPDGTIQYAENPPKKYQDIFPFHFETPAWQALWRELKSVVDFWIGEGVRIFRVDNPHTKPFAFWEWLIGCVKAEHADVIFLAEAFTRPKVMHRLAKLGFTQSYTYFAWRNSKHELTEYFTELTQGDAREYFRPNLWPNTPDILTEYLQFSGREGFMVRLTLAATLGATYGIYGPAFELLEHEPREPGSEEYLDSEKYQRRVWDLAHPASLAPFIARVNRIRRDNPALQSDRSLCFHAVGNDALLCYSKRSDDGGNVVLCVVNLDPHHAQAGWLDLDLQALGLEEGARFQAHDLLSDARFLWQGRRNYVALDPARGPAHLLLVRRRVRSERDFDYFL